MSDPPEFPELPAASAEFNMILAIVHAITRSMPRKKRAEFLADVSRALGLQEAAYNILRFRPRSEDKEVYATLRRAQAWWRQILGVLTRME